MSEKNIHDFSYVHRHIFRQGTSLRPRRHCCLPGGDPAAVGNRGSHGHLPVTAIPRPSQMDIRTKKSDGQLLQKQRALPPSVSARMTKAWLAQWSGTGMMTRNVCFVCGCAPSAPTENRTLALCNHSWCRPRRHDGNLNTFQENRYGHSSF
jgi:hypothetical protein